VPITCPNNSYVKDTPRFFDKGGNEYILPTGAAITWAPGDSSMATLNIAPDTRSAEIVPLRTAKGDYVYAYTYTALEGDVTVTETVTFEDPFPVSGKSSQVISSQALGAPQ
jgi:hypothetical protein